MEQKQAELTQQKNWFWSISPHCCLYVSLVISFWLLNVSWFSVMCVHHALLYAFSLMVIQFVSKLHQHEFSCDVVHACVCPLKELCGNFLGYVLISGIVNYGICRPSVPPGAFCNACIQYVKVALPLCPCQQLTSFSFIVFLFLPI